MREKALQLQQMQPYTELQTINESDISDDSFLVSDHQTASPTSLHYASPPSTSKNKRKAISLKNYQSTRKKRSAYKFTKNFFTTTLFQTTISYNSWAIS